MRSSASQSLLPALFDCRMDGHSTKSPKKMLPVPAAIATMQAVACNHTGTCVTVSPFHFYGLERYTFDFFLSPGPGRLA